MKKSIYIVRHGETDYNRQGIVQGSGVDASLNALGRQQARAFYEKYREIAFDAVLTSRLRRTHETMAPFIEGGLPWEQFAEINEMNWGIHEGKKATPEMAKQYDSIKHAWEMGDFDAKLPRGESAAELAARLQQFIQHLRQRPEEKLLVCSHGRAMCCLVTLLKDLSLTKMNQFRHSNTGLWTSNYNGLVFEFELENDTSHLEHMVIGD